MIQYKFPVDANGTVFDPAQHNLLEETAQPQLSPKGNFCRIRPNNPNSPELIERFLATLDIEETGKDVSDDEIDALLAEAGIDEDIGLDDPVEPDATQPAEDLSEEQGIDDLNIEDAGDDDKDIMSEPLTALQGEPSPVAPEAPSEGVITTPRITSAQIGKMAKLHHQSTDPTNNRANLSNGGTAENGYRGNGYDLSGIDLQGQDLRATVFNDCDLTCANFTNCNLQGAMFVGAKLKGANFTNAKLDYAVVPDYFRDVAKLSDPVAQLKKATVVK